MKQNIPTLHLAARSQSDGLSLELCTAALFVTLGGLLLTATGSTALSGLTAAFFAAGLAVLALRYAAARLQKLHLFYPALLALLLLAALIGHSALTNAAAQLQNALRDQLAARRGLLIAYAGAKDGSCILLGLVAGALSALLCRALCICPPLGSVLCAAISALCAYFLAPAVLWMALSAACAVWLLARCGWHGRPGLTGVLACALLTAILCGVCAASGLTAPLQNAQSGVLSALHTARYEAAEGPLPEGDLAAPIPEAGNAQQLTVTASGTQDLYLRGFIGDSYSAGRWTALDPARTAEQKDLLYWLHRSGFDTQSQLALAASCMGQTPLDSVSICVQNACAAYRYEPYSVTSGTNGVTAGRLMPSAVQTAGPRGQRSYSYQTLDAAADTIVPLLTFLQTDQSAQTQNYLQQESAYRAFVRSYALDVPTEFTNQYGALLRQYGAPDQDAAAAQQSAQAFLNACFDGKTAQLLAKTANGSIYQYVTIAVLALRYYGIPARYCEGYFVPAAALSEGQAAVTAASATAWIEVYQDGLGWLPADVTPGYEGLAAQQTQNGVRPASAGNKTDASGLRVPDGKELHEEQQDEQTQPEPQPQDAVHTALPKALLRTLLIVLAALVLLVLALVLRRRLLLQRRARRLAGAARADAAALVYAESAALLEKLGLRRGNGSMLPVCTAAAERFGPDYGAQLTAMTALNARALFSTHDVTSDDCTAMQDLRAQTCALLQKNTNILQRFQMRWLQCLY